MLAIHEIQVRYPFLQRWLMAGLALLGSLLIFTLALTAVTLGATAPAPAGGPAPAIQLFEANLAPANETPAVDSLASGRAVLALISDTLHYRVLVADITDVTASHIHVGAPGVAGPVVFPLFSSSGGDTFDATHPISGSLVLSATQISQLLAGDYYINVHSIFFPGGEIRGQVHPYTAPSAYNALLLGRNESIPVDTPAKGLAQLTLTNTNTLQYQIAVSDIISITAAHIHLAPPGQNGPVVHGLYNGSVPFDPDHPISGTVTLSATDLVDLLTGYFYVNVHTTANPGGEMRGQIGGVRLFDANLTGAAETPPRVTNASGRAVLALSADATQLAYRVTVNDLDDISASHIHRGASGVAGPVIFPLFSNSGGARFDASHPVSGTLTLNVAQVLNLIGDNYYVNVHTPTAPAGALRGQIKPLTPPSHLLATLRGVAEVPAVSSDALGIARFTLDPLLDTLHYNIWVTDIVDITASHIHWAPAGKNGPVIFPLYTGSGNFDPAHPIGDAAMLNASNWVDLLTGYYYVNVHTTAHGSGEMRGQIGGAQLFRADLAGANEVPAVDSAATGLGIAALSADAATLDYRVMVSNIISITAAHVHKGPVGVNGGVVVPILSPTGTFPVSGTLFLNTPLVFDLLGENYYVNVHTAANPGGEIRGQVLSAMPDTHFATVLEGIQETPAVSTTAGGKGYLTLEPAFNILHYTVALTDIVSTTASHIHLAPAGISGPVVFPLFNASSGGAFDADNPVGGCVMLNSKQLVDLLTGYYYINVHTTAHPSGEIRGQIGTLETKYLPLISNRP